MSGHKIKSASPKTATSPDARVPDDRFLGVKLLTKAELDRTTYRRSADATKHKTTSSA
jgi:hypothetical protein